MDSELFEKRVARLLQVNEVIAKLAPSIQAPAFQLLAPYVTARTGGESLSEAAAPDGAEESDAVAPADFETFLTRHTASDTKPAENVNLIAAYLYSVYGTEPFSTEDIRKTGEEAGLIVPHRVDMTLKGAKRDGRPIYMKDRGGYRPTVLGETVLKATYGVSKGRQRRAPAGGEA